MKRFGQIRFLIFWIFWLGFQTGFCQVQFGTNGYVEYRRGNLPIVISAPHGGSLTPAAIPDRTCPNITKGTDLNTIDLAIQIDSSFFALTGCHVHLVLCRLHRNKLDVNREINEAACGNKDAEKAWAEYHGFIDSALQTSLKSHGAGFYFDLHGHGHPKQRIELGYGLTGDQLRQSNSYLNTSSLVNQSSIRNLSATNVNHLFHSSLLRGGYALGTLLGEAGYPAVPSMQIPAPDVGDDFYSGGYSTEVHTSIQPTSVINGVQIECYRVGIRDTYASRKAFADSLARVLVEYVDYHLSRDLTRCSTFSGSLETGGVHTLFPNPVMIGEPLMFSGSDLAGASFRVYNLLGTLIQEGVIEHGNKVLIEPSLTAGTYFVLLDKRESRGFHKIVIN